MNIITLTTLRSRRNIFLQSLPFIIDGLEGYDFLHLNLSNDEFSSLDEVYSFYDAPELRDPKVRVFLVQDIGPYTKIIPTLRRVSKVDAVLSIDDDIIYERSFFTGFLCHISSDGVVASRGREIKKNFLGRFQSYLAWPTIKRKQHALDILPLGVGGILYKKRFFCEASLSQDFNSIAPGTDDLLLRAITLSKGIKVEVYPEIFVDCREIEHDLGLQSTNNAGFSPHNIAMFLFLKKIQFKAKCYLGLNNSRNDRNWTTIVQAYDL